MATKPRRRGFTLVEMLVVIAIIAVLVAILFPVFTIVRKKARKTQCISRLSQLAIALKSYKEDNGRYPPPPVFVNGRYYGGFSALYPDYVESWEGLICPEDADVRGAAAQAKQVVYSSYNGKATDPRGGNWTLTEEYYNFFGYTFSAPPPGPINSTGVDNRGLDDPGYIAAVMSEYRPEGLRQRDLPRLANRNAPGNTIATHCARHASDAEILLRVDGTYDVNAGRSALEQDPDGAGPKVAPYLGQRK